MLLCLADFAFAEFGSRFWFRSCRRLAFSALLEEFEVCGLVSFWILSSNRLSRSCVVEESLSARVLAKLLKRVSCCLVVSDLSAVEFWVAGQVLVIVAEDLWIVVFWEVLPCGVSELLARLKLSSWVQHWSEDLILNR